MKEVAKEQGTVWMLCGADGSAACEEILLRHGRRIDTIVEWDRSDEPPSVCGAGIRPGFAMGREDALKAAASLKPRIVLFDEARMADSMQAKAAFEEAGVECAALVDVGLKKGKGTFASLEKAKGFRHVFADGLYRSRESGYNMEKVATLGALLKTYFGGGTRVTGILRVTAADSAAGSAVTAREAQLLLREMRAGGLEVCLAADEALMYDDSLREMLGRDLFGGSCFAPADGADFAAETGVIWSKEAVDIWPDERKWAGIGLPMQGVCRALLEMRVPYCPVNIHAIDRFAGSLLIVPEQPVWRAEDREALAAFIKKGGSAVLIGELCRAPESGCDPVAELLGLEIDGEPTGAEILEKHGRNVHSYLEKQKEHSVFEGLEECSVVAFGGRLQCVRSCGKLEQIAGWVPGFPISPCEFAYIEKREPERGTVFAGNIGAAEVVCFAGDVDRLYGRDGFADYGRLLKNAFRRCGAKADVKVEGAGTLDVRVRREEGVWQVSILNLTGVSPYGGHDITAIPVCGARAVVTAPALTRAVDPRSGKELPIRMEEGAAVIPIPEFTDDFALWLYFGTEPARGVI